ncbi:18188_t:CDS:2, partial [Funneliformis geosporum]
MSDDIISHAFRRMENEMLEICFNKLYESFVEDNKTHFRILNITTKYLLNDEISLDYPTIYSKFLAITSFVPNPRIDRSYFSNKERLSGYTENIYRLHIYEYNFFKNIGKPMQSFTKYPLKYNFWKELLIPPANPFVTLNDLNFYNSWDAEAIYNHRWQLIWTCLNHNLLEYLKHLWNWLDIFAYILPVCAAIVWLNDKKPPLTLISLSNLSLHFKFITFFRAFDTFGINFTIIFGVAKRIMYFLYGKSILDTSDNYIFILGSRLLAEIELYFLLPNQRRWRHWFPDT